MRDSTVDDPTSAQARVIVSLNYVQVLRREIEAGRLSPMMLEDYLARLEFHLIEVERISANVSNMHPVRHGEVVPSGVEDRLISERFTLTCH